MPRPLSPEQQAEIRRLAAKGHSRREIARMLGRSWHGVNAVMVRDPARPTTWNPSPARLSRPDREEIRAGLERGETFTAIAARIGRAVSTVSREVAANGGRAKYRAWKAHDAAGCRARRPKTAKLANPALVAEVSGYLLELWSPVQISRRLRAEHRDDANMWVSHETIYKSLYVQGRGELRRELTRCLRTGRTARKPHSRIERRGKIPDMVNISQRPPEVADRAVPGHWEGDLIIGRAGRSAVGTLVERTTRFVLLLHLPDGHGAVQVAEAMKTAMLSLPRELARSLTWDQGSEMYGHAKFTIDTGIPVYFCDPHSPWQRGSNENANGLLRQYMPKGTDLSIHSPEDLARIAASLNNRPRQTLGFMKPSERLAELLAATN